MKINFWSYYILIDCTHILTAKHKFKYSILTTMILLPSYFIMSHSIVILKIPHTEIPTVIFPYVKSAMERRVSNS